MKIYALAILVVCCIVGNASAARDWKSDVKIGHWQHINSIVNDTLARIQSDVSSKGTPAANQCYEDARLALRSISQSGYNAVSSCVSSASTAGLANLCAQPKVSEVFNQALEVSRTARTCVQNA